MVSASDALSRLVAGNARFVSGDRKLDSLLVHRRRLELVEGQQPFAAILGCSDSRVPVELVFDQGLGDLFVIRVAGNVVAESQIGSIEFAAESFGIRLVVVLGHSGCGAIAAVIKQLRTASEERSPNLRSIVDRIRPSVAELIDTHGEDDETLFEHAVRANVRASVDRLRHGSAILEGLVERDELAIVGAEYSLDTGAVEFFEAGSVTAGVS